MASEEKSEDSLSAVVAIDGCRISHRAFEVARSLVRGPSGKLTVLHVSDAKIRELLPHITPNYIATEYDVMCSHAGLGPAQREVVVVDMQSPAAREEHGSRKTKEVVAVEAAKAGAEVLVLGAFGMKGASIWAIGGGAEWSVRRSRLHTLIVRPEVAVEPAAGHVPTVVIAVDGTEEMTRRCCRVAARVRPGARVVVFHVRDEWAEQRGRYSARTMRKCAAEALHDAFDDVDIVVADHEPHKPVSHQVSDFVASREADLLVVGVDGMTAFLQSRPTLGSVTDYVVKRARCNVLICKR